jgi:hypothetical protein
MSNGLGLTHCLHYHKYVLQNLRAIEEAVEHENKGKRVITLDIIWISKNAPPDLA